ncbi:DEAD/DEAH box helicase, partial [Cutibacterium acnes]
SIKSTSFPFAQYRKGKRNLAVASYNTIINKKKLFAQAPTGIGKTISTLFPAVKALGEGHTSKIFYLTAKTITRSVAEESISLMTKKGLHVKSVTITAKEKICFKDEAICTPENCEYAKGHYDRINTAMYDALMSEDNLSRENIEVYAKKHMVCPFEFTLDLTLFADIIICD